jgi:cytoskeletal protein CcmA (bactofilin family)
VIIGATGSIQGEVRCQNAVIEGKFDGILKVTDLLHVKETAKIQGTITTGKIIVQSGAVFNVNCQMGNAQQPNGAIKHSKELKEIVETAAV